MKDKPVHQRVGLRNINMHGYENENTKVIGYVGYNPKTDHIWRGECKHCGSVSETTAKTLMNRKSCGCKRETVNKESWAHELAKAWLRRPLC